MAEKTNVYPYRAPKKYPKKSLHGRIRFGQLPYKDFKRFQRFYVNVFGWDMFELPEAAGGVKKGSDKPSLLIATGPSYETWEGLNPGHMNMGAHYAEHEENQVVFMAECHMDRPLKETAREIIEHGGSIVGEVPEEKRRMEQYSYCERSVGKRYSFMEMPEFEDLGGARSGL